MSEGIFITFEGPEGSGKSTHSARLAKELAADGYDVLRTAEPGSTALGAKIRDILLEKKEINLCAAAELFLFESDRAQHVKEVIVPALKSGKIVICDRFNTATYAYQGYGLGMDKELIARMDDAATERLSPDITLLLDVDAKMGLQRAAAGRSADRMESRDIAFHERVRGGYLDMAKKYPDKIRVVKVIDGVDDTYALVRKEVYDFVERHKGAR